MNFNDKIKQVVDNVTAQKDKLQTELDQMEKDFADIKLNPYGITSIDFTRRQEISLDNLKMEGVLMGLQLALETFEETQGATS